MKIMTGLMTGAVAAASLNCGMVRADLNDWYMQQLFEPSETQLAMERRGRVMIYDGLHDKDVQRALQQQFDRVEYMMFTGTVVTDERGEPARDKETGEILVEDDGCE